MPAGGQQRRILEAARRRRRRSRQVRVWRGLAKVLAWWAGLGRRVRVLIVGSVAVAAVAVVVAGLVLPAGPAPRARQYLAFTACLLTDAHGLAGAPAAAVWAGMQQASLSTRAKVEYLPVMAGPTAAAAQPVLASLAARHCQVIIGAGPAQAAAVAASASRYPAIRFAVAGGSARGRNVTELAGSASAVRAAANRLVTRAVAATT